MIMTALIFEVDELSRMKLSKTTQRHVKCLCNAIRKISIRLHNVTSKQEKHKQKYMEKRLFTLLIPMQRLQTDPK